MKIEDSIAFGLFVIFFLIVIYWEVRTSSKMLRKAKFSSFEADSTYYSYTTRKPFYMRLFSSGGIRSPYCETCHKWVQIYSPMLGIPVTENVLYERQESDIVKSLSNQDWSVLKTSERLPTWRIIQPAIRISLGRCKTCDGPFCVLGEIRGQTNKGIILEGLFSIEINKNSALELLETAIDRNLTANNSMYAKAVDFCKALGSSKDFAQVALAHQRKEKARALGHRGLWELGYGILDEAETHLTNALTIFEELGERKDQAIAYRSLASVYHRRKNHDHAETLVKKSVELFEELNDKPEMAIGYGFLGQIQFDRKEFDRAEPLVRKALEIDSTLNNKRGMVTGYHALGAIHKALDKREQAKGAYTEALRLCKELGDLSLEKAMQTELDRLLIQSKNL
ncbi:MAG: tetratricopeptide repeat protein [Proteobacteria bacterium]|nr:tetratricopeptide repeat protein [Pseudomonadota bacterium]